MANQATKIWSCAACEAKGIADDEVFLYNLRVGIYKLCLECGPEENYENLER